MSRSPEITVAITTHDQEKYIEKCISELLSQSFQDFEIIVYDDCSADATPGLLRSLCSFCADRMKVLFGTVLQGGGAGSRNAILESGLIRGRYIVFLDGDDSIEPDFLEKLHACALENDADIAMCGYDRVEFETGHVLGREMVKPREAFTLPENGASVAFLNNAPWNKLFKAACIGSTRFETIKVGEDALFMISLFRKCPRVAFTEEVLIHYMVHRQSVMNTISKDTAFCFINELVSLWKESRETWCREMTALYSFMHIGLSMPFRMAADPAMDMKSVLAEITAIFREDYGWFRGIRQMRLFPMMKLGLKGFAMWGALLCYKLHIFPLFLRLYYFLTDTFHIDIKY